MQEATDNGVRVAKEWSCRFKNSRETHMALHGKVVMEGEKFQLSDGDELEYPGDPNGRAGNVINCYCVMIPRVLKKNESLPLHSDEYHGRMIDEPIYQKYGMEEL